MGAKPNQHYPQLLVIAGGLFAATLMVMDDLLICHSNTPDTMIDDNDGEVRMLTIVAMS